MTTKISWNEFNKVPYDTFMWKGIDGTEILSHFSPSTDCFDEGDCWQTTYNAYLNPEHILGGWHRYSQKDLNKEYLCTFGHGDGGGDRPAICSKWVTAWQRASPAARRSSRSLR